MDPLQLSARRRAAVACAWLASVDIMIKKRDECNMLRDAIAHKQAEERIRTLYTGVERQLREHIMLLEAMIAAKETELDIRSNTARHCAAGARAYLHGRCAEFGATLERHVYALVHAQEMERIGTTTASDIGNLPICPECYVERCVARRQFAPVDKPKQDL